MIRAQTAATVSLCNGYVVYCRKYRNKSAGQSALLPLAFVAELAQQLFFERRS